MKYILLFLVSIISLYGDAEGRLLFYGNCITCHHPTKSISAPSMAEVKQRYMDVFTTKKEFVEYMSTWVIDPNENGSIIKDAIKKYSLMPQLGFDISTTKSISSFIYETDFKTLSK